MNATKLALAKGIIYGVLGIALLKISISVGMSPTNSGAPLSWIGRFSDFFADFSYEFGYGLLTYGGLLAGTALLIAAVVAVANAGKTRSVGNSESSKTESGEPKMSLSEFYGE